MGAGSPALDSVPGCVNYITNWTTQFSIKTPMLRCEERSTWQLHLTCHVTFSGIRPEWKISESHSTVREMGSESTGDSSQPWASRRICSGAPSPLDMVPVRLPTLKTHRLHKMCKNTLFLTLECQEPTLCYLSASNLSN